jgi:predicted permease
LDNFKQSFFVDFRYSLVLPLVTRELVSVLQAGADVNETIDLSNYGFLYGTFPTAPGVFVYSTQFNVDADLVASAMVACTFLSAPLMVRLVHYSNKNKK